MHPDCSPQVGIERRFARAWIGLAALLLCIPCGAQATPISMPFTFSNGTVANADQVNANFDTLVLESNDQDTRISTLEAVGADITAVTAGSGLLGGGLSGAVALSVNTATIQSRVTGSCAPGQSIRVIESSGAVVCEIDNDSGGTITGVTAGAGLTGGGSSGGVTLAVDSTALNATYVNASGDTMSGALIVPALTVNGDLECTDCVDSGDVDSSEVRIDWTTQPAHPACSSYALNTDMTREVGYYDSTTSCDSAIGTAWTRFTDGAKYNRVMPTTMPKVRACDTHAPGYLVGDHPAVEDGEVTRKVCFHWNDDSCNWSTDIQVVNCGEFYVYELVNTPACSLRYCTEPVDLYPSQPIVAKFYPTVTVAGLGNWQFNATAFSTSIDHFTNNTSSITVEISGIYEVCQNLMYSNLLAGDVVRTDLKVNGTILHDTLQYSGGSYARDAYCTTLQLNAGDDVEFYNPLGSNDRYGSITGSQGYYSHVTFTKVR